MSKTHDVMSVGTALVDSIIRGFDPTPVSAAGYRAASGTLNVGGEAVNTALAAAKLGARAGILCALGRDAAGDLVEETLRRGGVDVGAVVRPGDHSTPVTTMFVADDGSRRSITNGAHRRNFHPERYLGCLTGTRAVLLGSLFRAPFDDPEIVLAVARAARDSGALVFADTKLPTFRRLTLADLSRALPLLDYVTPNEDEARFYAPAASPEAMADRFLELGVKNVIVKLGPGGCLLKNAEATVRLPACRVRAVDATGAGDNFLAGFVCELLRGSPPEQALRFANACGAVCVTAAGANTALRSRDQVLALLAEQESL